MANTYADQNVNMEPVSAATKKETDRKCPCCGAVISYDPSSGKLSCPYCGHEEEISVEDQAFVPKELDFNTAEDMVSTDWGTATKSVKCKSCGAETIYDANQIASQCPYCGSNQVVEAGGQKIMAPGGVVLFKLDAKAAMEKFRGWIKNSFFCPKKAKDNADPDAFQGLYVPFWTFDSKTRSNYTGEYGIERKVKDKEGHEQTVTDWHRTSGVYTDSFDDVAVCGSSQMNDSMLASIEPFDTNHAAPYKPEYLAGFSAERYTVKMKDAWEKAKEKIGSILHGRVSDRIRSDHRADSVRSVALQTAYSAITYKYILVPVWISSFEYNGKTYHFMINGQTGKVSGNLPVSWLKVAAVTAAVVLVIGAVFYFLMRD